MSGISVLNASGNILIDQNFSNYAITQSGTVSWDGVTRGNGTINFTNYGGLIPLVFVRVVNSTSYINVDQLTTSSFRAAALDASTVDWYVAFPSNVVPAPTDSFGLRVFKPDGAASFDSRLKSPRVMTVTSFAETPGFPSERTITFAAMPSGQKPYFLVNGITELNGVGDAGDEAWLLQAAVKQPNATSIVLAYRVEQIVPGVQGAFGDYFMALTIPISERP